MYFTVQYIYNIMIKILKNLTKKKIAGLLLILVIIVAFGLGGFGGGFNTGNQNNIAKINNTNISTQDFMDYLNQSGLSQQVIKENINKNVLEELLTSLVSTKLLELEIQDLDLKISEEIIIKRLKLNKNFHDENGKFQRTLYEKFLLTKNISAPIYEIRLKNNILQKQLFTYISGGSNSPKFLISKYYKEKNRKLDVEYINLNQFYKSKDDFTKEEIQVFISENSDKLKQDYIDFSYVIISPKNLTGLDEFNQLFFDKIDDIENKIAKNVDFKIIVNDLNIEPIIRKEYINLENEENIENKIYNSRKDKISIFENDGKYVFYQIDQTFNRLPTLDNKVFVSQIRNLLFQKKKFDFNKNILNQIDNKKFSQSSFDNLGSNLIKKVKLNSPKDDTLLEVNSVELLYSLPINSFTLVSDYNDNIFVAKTLRFEEVNISENSKKFNAISNEASANNRNSILKSYDFLLNDKYKVVINENTLERVKNYFK